MIVAGIISLFAPIALFFIEVRLERHEKALYCFRRTTLLIYVILVIYVTLFMRAKYQLGAINLRPFWSYAFLDRSDIRWQIYMNVFLFIPFGFMLEWNFDIGFIRTVLVGILFSAILETAQYIFGLGLCEVDDVIHNTMGTAIGCGYDRLLSDIGRRS